MHEYSVVSSLLELCEKNVKEYENSHNTQDIKVLKVIVGIGERSGMDKSLFMSAFEGFKAESKICKDADLEIIEEKIELECKDCHHQFTPKELCYTFCLKCGGKNVKVIKGEEMLLLRLELGGGN